MNWLYFLAICHLANGRPVWELGIDPVPLNDEDTGYDALDRRLTANILWLLPRTVAKFPEPLRIRKVRFTTQDAYGDELKPIGGAIVHLKGAMSRTKVFMQPHPNNKLKVSCRFDLNKVRMAYRFKVKILGKNTSRVFKWQFGPRSHVTLEALLDMDQPCLMHMRQGSSFNLELVEGKVESPGSSFKNTCCLFWE
uniref:UDP-N-acetylmuramoylalanine--D-glutamate ligase n=1 Tax=Lygus hesperus TaxID=30085 RepID=A0A0A9ZCC4_LYGHE